MRRRGGEEKKGVYAVDSIFGKYSGEGGGRECEYFWLRGVAGGRKGVCRVLNPQTGVGTHEEREEEKSVLSLQAKSVPGKKRVGATVRKSSV